jgi:hypothetical protein
VSGADRTLSSEQSSIIIVFQLITWRQDVDFINLLEGDKTRQGDLLWSRGALRANWQYEFSWVCSAVR